MNHYEFRKFGGVTTPDVNVSVLVGIAGPTEDKRDWAGPEVNTPSAMRHSTYHKESDDLADCQPGIPFNCRLPDHLR